MWETEDNRVLYIVPLQQRKGFDKTNVFNNLVKERLGKAEESPL